MRIPHPRSDTEVRQAFQALTERSDVITTGASDYILVGQGIGVAPVWQVLSSAIDHGGLGGLEGDDHTQYHNNTRGDARYYTETELDAGQLDTIYFQESEFLNSSAGAGDAGKPIKLDAAGHIDATMVNDGDVDHGGLTGLGDDDHPQYAIGTIQATNNNAGTIYKCYAVFADDNDDVDLTDASDVDDSKAIGLVADTSIASAASGSIRTSGMLSATTGQWDTCGAGVGSGLVAGTKYYLGTAAGTLSPTKPTQPSQYTVSIGIALNTTDMLIRPQKVNDVVEQITSDLTIYVSTAGSDAAGIGDSGSPLASLAGALDFLGPKLIASTATVTIQIADGTYTETSATEVAHANGDRIVIQGENVYSRTLTNSPNSIVSSSGTPGAWSIVLQLDSIANITVNEDYLLVPYNVTGGTRPSTLSGCWLITNVDAGNTRITIATTCKNGNAPSGAVSGTVKVVKTILEFTGCHGLEFAASVNLGSIDKVVLLGDSTANKYGIYLKALSSCTAESANFGVTGFVRGAEINFASVLKMNYGIISSCSTRGVSLVDASLQAKWGVFTGCGDGLNITQGNIVINTATVSGNTNGAIFGTISSGFFAGTGKCNYNTGIGITAQFNSYVFASTTALTGNGTAASPAVNSTGGPAGESYITS